MLPLDSPRWNELQHAYGPAGNIAALIGHAESFPPSDNYRDEPYFSLWSALCHQDDVYPASYAALPHFVRIIATDPVRAHWQLFSLCSAIERHRHDPNAAAIPDGLLEPYVDALAKLPALVAEAAASWDELRSRALLGAFAAARGSLDLAAAIEAFGTHETEETGS